MLSRRFVVGVFPCQRKGDDEEAESQGYQPYIPKDKEPDWKKFVR